jgi:hypothetical protein
MVKPRRFGALFVVLPQWYCYACTPPGDYADKLATEIEIRTVPPSASGVSVTRSEAQPCVIRTQWTFATSWDRGRYGDWLKAQLSPQFAVVWDGPTESTFSRHDDGDTHSVTIETPSRGDSLAVRVTLCVYPD